MQDLTDKDLVMLAVKGDMKAFERLVSIYEKPIFGYILRFVNHKENAEDLTQETFIKIFRSLKTFDPEYKFKTWLFTVATNTVYDWLRKAKKNKEMFIVDDPDINFETIDDRFSYKLIEDKELIDNALKNIKPVYQSAIVLFYRDELTYDEISEVLNVPINTVKTYIYRAKKALSEHLK
ncbi:MAG: hypothetical protein A2537_00495 [Candidatus Magasanikbacteria bacterium RIFOXYD2_FULL_36_9]|jgi:RNA polymerase sigma-70 factor (ECF subfamily)|uniref:RNA polymerase sigma factor n=1 Tax=Candidatus Magasanikbacteria bacterium RIFOXYD2_FULL_36_9 TaxID=1798707 RepID=A0A1F6NYY4_9BACT|nr:MAG: hypothetical protein A2537_00495 [Candidatus Magasanikbacteria bacterium RIFOXYD2_FULL_36_9]